MEAKLYHTPVLLQETLDYLLTTKSGIYFDGTLGGGGHADAILSNIGNTGKLIGIDLDDDAIEIAKKRLERFTGRFFFYKANFKNIKSVLSHFTIHKVQGILLDLGVSSYQIDEPSKGFSYRFNNRLDMRMDQSGKIDAIYIVNNYSEDMLSKILWEFGEEKYSRKIARAIVHYRKMHKIDLTSQLALITENCVGKKFLTKSLARVFQAIRIEVNAELDNLQQALYDCIDVLEPSGRLVVISYHSLEDRLVKNFFRNISATSVPSGNKIAAKVKVQSKIRILTKKPVTASENEQKNNSRARSAKLRAAEKL